VPGFSGSWHFYALQEFLLLLLFTLMSSSDTPSPDQDLTPLIGSQTDIAPLGRGGKKPEHERTADEDVDPIEWARIANDPDFRALMRRKARLVIPATVFFLIYYFLLPLGVGWFPGLMERKVWGAMNIAYLYALSQFLMAWILAGIYVVVASGWDRQQRHLLNKFGVGNR